MGNRDYWRRWDERFGFFTPDVRGPFDLWVHAVSVGEALIAVPLINHFRNKRPETRIIITTTTPTGSGRVRAALGDSVDHVYMPYDLPGAVHRFLTKAKPGLAVFMETELWPNTFYQCARRSVPVVVVNARLSERSARGYLRFPRLVGPMMQCITAIAAQSGDDAKRFLQIGSPEGRVQVTGSIKFDINLPASLKEQAQVLRRTWGEERNVWVAASTHEGEDELVLEAFDRVVAALPDCLLL
ncbi:MAG: 3-deoxy-D-manno-octulosonic acid transferase, partial [Gammaproteobacteria bacterium]|nr:3-deoxy-D-manno-octulosonic acid transferase [Gammaproteobacteria bacterium]